LQGSAKLDLSANGHYISCDTAYTWSGFLYDDASHSRENLPIGYRWADESLIGSLKAFHTVAVCPTSTLKGTIQIIGLPGIAMQKLADNNNPQAIFTVVDTGGKLCEANKIDIFTGEGEDAFKDTKIFWDKPVQVIQR
jgi:3D (Asp-Asp-Asp) domain-containing protein